MQGDRLAKPTYTTICYFPGRESSYARTRILLKAMESAGLNVLDCSYPKKIFFRYIYGFWKFLSYKKKADIIFVGFLGQHLMPIVRLLTNKKIIFDAFVSVYLTLVFDRKSIPDKGLRSQLARWIDQKSCQNADKVLLDTHQQIEFFVKEYSLDQNKFERILVGSDDNIMTPQDASEADEFLVHFHGEFQGLHGVEYILKAAALIPDISFQVIGKGRDWKKALRLATELSLKNIRFIDPVPYEELPKYMSKASVCLGLFGDTIKTQAVIPHKVYEALAVKRAVITSDTPAVRELLIHKKDAYLCEAANPESLANAITELKNNPSLRKSIAEAGRKTFDTHCTPQIIGKQIQHIAEQLIN